MFIAGEPSGDLLAAELVRELAGELAARGQPAPRFFGAGGPEMAAAGVDLSLDLTHFAIIGLADVLRNLWRLRRILERLLDLAGERRPDVVVCVDYGGFNRRFAGALRRRLPADRQPRLVQYVSPQVWASRPGRARTLARDLDLLISILPFEKAWYAERFPGLRVEFVGHPIIDRHVAAAGEQPLPEAQPARIVLLPGSRRSEVQRHWPLMIEAARLIKPATPASWVAVFPNDAMRAVALRADPASDLGLHTSIGNLGTHLAGATLALAATGTVTLECALWGVPTIAVYCASWSTAFIVRRIIRVRHLAMPNLLADATVMPELLQGGATRKTIAGEANRLLRDPRERERTREQLREVIHRLGPPGAARRAAQAVLSAATPGRWSARASA